VVVYITLSHLSIKSSYRQTSNTVSPVPQAAHNYFLHVSMR